MKTYQTQADMHALENRYGAGFAQYLADQMDAVSSRPIEFLDVKHLNDTVAEHRARIRDLVASCRAAGNGADTALLRRQIAEMRDVYRSALLDSRVLMAEYMRRLKTDGVDAMRIATAKAA
jgi:hypothetical protein